jgi:two-component system CheB/CheR fusion protein
MADDSDKKGSHHATKKRDKSQSEPIEKDVCCLVAIGASAGGLAALRRFFADVPADSGLAFVVVMHLSPEHESHLTELLQPHAKIPVQQVTETVKLVSNRVYVIPPGANLDAIDTHLRLSELEERRSERAPIDHFFRTVASTHDGHSVGVILTGTGSDGTLGLREIKEKGGLIVIQDPNDAEFDGMPQSALATGMADMVLPLAELVPALLRVTHIQPDLPHPKEGDDIEGEPRRLLHKIFAHVRARTGRDFSRYKRSTILRRIERRMQIRQTEELAEYVGILRDENGEVNQLADDLLVTVTNFFRDVAVFDVLEQEIIPALFKGKGLDDDIRVWSVGCATGEEAYSLAMLLMEEAARHEAGPRVQVFATDLHDLSLRKAREGFYSGDIQADVSPARLKRFFVKESGGYRIRKEVRELVVFAPHNLMGDPPFSRIDLITCRNLLIYIQRDRQQDIIELFHYALRSNGFLVLGTSESLEASDLFVAENKKCCVFRKRDVLGPEPRLPVFPQTPRHLPAFDQIDESKLNNSLPYGVLHQRMVERYAPPSVLLDPDDKIVHLSEHAGRYLQHPGGELTASLWKLLRDELRFELRAAVHSCRSGGKPIRTKPIPALINDEPHLVVLHVRAAIEPQHEGYVLVIFDESQADIPQETLAASDMSGDNERVRLLELEIDRSKHRLRALVEEYETSQEEMKASNEELQSTNEELRSTMEELETSKEELQSMNEELQTVNQEHRHKVDELAQLTGDLQNLLAATEIATLFLDRDLRIMRFTPKLADLFNIRLTDRGRPISDITNRIGYPDLMKDSEGVLKNLVPMEREVGDEGGHWYLTRVLPYRSTDDRIEGVVITFVEITERKAAEASLAVSEAEYRTLFESAAVGNCEADVEEGRFTRVNQRYCELTGYSEAELLNKAFLDITHPDDRVRNIEALTAYLAHPEGNFQIEKRYVRRDGSYVWIHLTARLLRENDRPPRYLCSVFDVSDRLRIENELKALNESLEQQIAKRTEMLRLLQDVTRSANEARTVEEAMRGAMERLIDYAGWRVGHLWLPVEGLKPKLSSSGVWHLSGGPKKVTAELKAFQRASEQQVFDGDLPLTKVLQTGSPVWIDDLRNSKDSRRALALKAGLTSSVALPVTVEGEVAAVLEFLADHPATREERFVEILPHFGSQLGHVIERRRVDRLLADATEREQRRIGQDIHDGLGQELTGLRYLAKSHQEALVAAASPQATDAGRIMEGLDTVQRQLRTIIRELVPVEVDREGLVAALESLARHTTSTYSVTCTVEINSAPAIENTLLATHLYRIAQEAVANAVKHAHAQRVAIRLGMEDGDLYLHVLDDGVGLGATQTRGYGLRGMAFRAELVGGRLDVETRPEGGVAVRCWAPYVVPEPIDRDPDKEL